MVAYQTKMNKLPCFIFIVLAFGVQLYTCKSLEPQIKVVGFQKNYVNPDYTSGLVYTIRHKNETFNNVHLYWNFIKNAPADIEMNLKVYVTDSTYQGGELVLDNVTPICRESENRQLLPNVLVFPESELDTECLQKGVVLTDTFQLYRFEVLLTGLEEKGKYYRTEYIMRNKDVLFFDVTVYTEWGYLHSC